ncbi:MAG: hypothetical protein ACOX2L_00070 [Anaerolineae bacterium]|jgi:hypothetical protein|nr:hypothetical protein [Chloroflexota bacterium]
MTKPLMSAFRGTCGWMRRLRRCVSLFCVWALLLAGCGAPDSPARLGESNGEPGGVHLHLKLGERVPILTQVVPEKGGWLLVDRLGDPLDGLELEVPAGSHDGPVTYSVSYRPIARDSDDSGMVLLSPLIQIDNGGQVAEAGVILKIPVYMYWRHFPAAWAWDEATGELEPLPVIQIEKSTVNIAARTLHQIVVTSHPYEPLEALEVSTSFDPREDMWPFANTATWGAPVDLAWGMSAGALMAALDAETQPEAPAAATRYAAGPGEGVADPMIWQDDAQGLAIVTALQQVHDRARQGRSYDPLYELTRELAGSFHVRSPRFTIDQITFYDLKLALAVTGEPQLVNASVAGGELGTTLLAYGARGNSILVADPNDDPATAPERLLTLQYGRFHPYVSSAPGVDGAPEERTYTEFSFVGQGAMSPWEEVQGAWAAGEAGDQGVLPAFTLTAEERDGAGGLVRESPLEPGGALSTAQPALTVRASTESDAPLRTTLWTAQAGAGGQPSLSLQPGEQPVGVLVEGLARWTDAAGVEQSGWRWLGFRWIRVAYTP